MKISEFNKIYNYAKTVIIVKDNSLLQSGWFWNGLTDKQLVKMYNLLLLQGTREYLETFTNKKYIQLPSGITLYRKEG